MEIEIRTYDDIRSERVRIGIALGQRVEIGLIDTSPSGRMFTEEELIAAQASEGELIGKALGDKHQRELADLRDKLAEMTKQRNAQHHPGGPWDMLHKRAAEVDRLKADLAAITQQRDTFKAQAYEQNDRAAQLRQTVQFLGDQHQRELADLQAKRSKVEELVAFKDKIIEETEQEAERLRSKIIELTSTNHRLSNSVKIETKERIRNRQWAERAEARTAQMHDRIIRAQAVLNDPQVTDAIDDQITKISARLAQAIKDAREALAPNEPTSET